MRSLLLGILCLFVLGAGGSPAWADLYESELARTLGKYGRHTRVPAASIRYLARKFNRDSFQVREDLEAKEEGRSERSSASRSSGAKRPRGNASGTEQKLSISPLLKHLDRFRSGDEAARDAATEVLLDSKTLPLLIHLLSNVQGTRCTLRDEAARKVNIRHIYDSLLVAGYHGGDSVLTVLRPFLGHPHEQLERVAVLSLGRTGNPKAAPMLTAFSTRDEETVKVWIEALGKLPDLSCAEKLLDLLAIPQGRAAAMKLTGENRKALKRVIQEFESYTMRKALRSFLAEERLSKPLRTYLEGVLRHHEAKLTTQGKGQFTAKRVSRRGGSSTVVVENDTAVTLELLIELSPGNEKRYEIAIKGHLEQDFAPGRYTYSARAIKTARSIQPTSGSTEFRAGYRHAWRFFLGSRVR